MWKGWEGLDVWHCSCKSRHASFCITCSNSVLFHKIPMQQQTKHTQPIYHLKLKFNLSSSLNWHVSFNSVCTQTNIFFFKISSKPLTASYLSWVLAKLGGIHQWSFPILLHVYFNFFHLPNQWVFFLDHKYCSWYTRFHNRDLTGKKEQWREKK